jgi:hypothetical protein
MVVGRAENTSLNLRSAGGVDADINQGFDSNSNVNYYLANINSF